ncbi:cytochrome c biogenesis protein ResB [Chlorobaculum sp. MV4-Y]|uniref:cytochrome c biogenesis protein ResB n=1 Tax=Chlorobaculum sp. MV4-Y TaxID=2976335 RepID=UPI0021AFC7F2|nr:cytochrome c biogenesis protein ResB [Chlorobaculum sp. MV4-Y]UWX56880.1 cytochrome c biogenesis protein ResB [Chlorobaculum sp. MV4-Y]
MSGSKNSVKAGSAPVGFMEAAFFTLVVILAGFGIELLSSGGGIDIPGWPFNLVFLLFFGGLIFAVGLIYREHPLVAWLGGIPLGLSLIIGLALLSLVGGVLPQDKFPPGSIVAMLRLNGMFSSWPFALVTLLFLFNLGLSLVWKTIPFRVANLQFMLFHGGFWIALSCGLLGTTQLERLVVPLYEGKASDVAYNRESEEAIHLPFSIYLKDFQIEQYAPKFALYDPEHDRLVEPKSKLVPEIAKGVRGEWPGLGSVTVLDYLPNAMPGADGVPVVVDGKKGVAFARVRIDENGKVSEHWISSGGPTVKPLFVPMGSYFIIMADGAPKAFRSEVTLIGAGGERITETLEVNKPVDFHGWKLYQSGYDESAGRWSTLSLVEAVRDPWLPAVYLGFFMIMAGNVLYFWKGFKKMEEA